MAGSLRVVLFGALLVTFAAGAGDDVYRWVDEAGEEHYTDDVSNIPRQFRKSAKKVEEPPVTRMPSTPATSAGGGEGSAYRSADAGTQDSEAAAEQRWRSQFGSARRRIAELEQQLQADRELLDAGTLGPLYNAAGAIVINPEVTAATKRVEQNERALVQARQDLEDLVRRATWEAVPLEWRRGD